MRIEDVLRNAISNHWEIEMLYAKKPGEGRRVCRPHVLFETAGGNLVLDAYQVGGYSSGGRLPEWRAFDVAFIEDVAPTGRRFEPAPGYHPDNATKYFKIIVRR
jgi:hypothetical protein